MRTGKKDEFSLCERMFLGQLRLAGNRIKNSEKVPWPSFQISPGTFSESLESCSQLASTVTQTTSQRKNSTLSPAIMVKMKE
jgi:hypothetical protein